MEKKVSPASGGVAANATNGVSSTAGGKASEAGADLGDSFKVSMMTEAGEKLKQNSGVQEPGPQGRRRRTRQPSSEGGDLSPPVNQQALLQELMDELKEDLKQELKEELRVVVKQEIRKTEQSLQAVAGLLGKQEPELRKAVTALQSAGDSRPRSSDEVLEREIGRAVAQAAKEGAADPVMRVGQLLQIAAGGSPPAQPPSQPARSGSLSTLFGGGKSKRAASTDAPISNGVEPSSEPEVETTKMKEDYRV